MGSLDYLGSPIRTGMLDLDTVSGSESNRFVRNQESLTTQSEMSASDSFLLMR
jgi:hypothetical protein